MSLCLPSPALAALLKKQDGGGGGKATIKADRSEVKDALEDKSWKSLTKEEKFELMMREFGVAAAAATETPRRPQVPVVSSQAPGTRQQSPSGQKWKVAPKVVVLEAREARAARKGEEEPPRPRDHPETAQDEKKLSRLRRRWQHAANFRRQQRQKRKEVQQQKDILEAIKMMHRESEKVILARTYVESPS